MEQLFSVSGRITLFRQGDRAVASGIPAPASAL